MRKQRRNVAATEEAPLTLEFTLSSLTTEVIERTVYMERGGVTKTFLQREDLRRSGEGDSDSLIG